MTQDPAAYAEMLKTSELALKEAATRLGNFHPDVLAMLDQYVLLLRQAGQPEKADQFEVRVKGLRAKAAEQQAAAAAAAAGTAPAGSVQGATSNQTGAQATSTNAAPASAEDAAKAEADAEERAMARAVAAALLEQKARAARMAREAADAAEAEEAARLAGPNILGDEEIFLFNSEGKHVAVVWSGSLYDADGKNLGRWDEGLEAFLDRDGSYLGQIVEENRLARDLSWPYKHMNFGDKGNVGHRSGWSRQPDIERTTFVRGFEDVELQES